MNGMPISSGDIKIFKSDTMADTIDGGGEKTQNEVISGESNSIFDDVSSLDRVFGAVHLRKVYPHVFTQDDDIYLSGHTIITKLPKDEQLGINLFSIGDYHDRRPAAQSRIESYRAKGGQYIGYLYATQWQGSKVVTIFQAETAPIPQISDVLYLTQISDSEFQFVKVTSVAESVQTFTIDRVTFKKRIVTLDISQELEYDFIGAQINQEDDITPQATLLHTVVADAASYYSARNLESAVLTGASTLFVDDIYSQVVPSSLQEVAEVGQTATDDLTGLFDGSDGVPASAGVVVVSAGGNAYLGSACMPGSLSLDTGASPILDNGGELIVDGAVIGTIDYETGVMSFAADAATYNTNATFTPATVAVGKAHTAITPIVSGNRGNLYTATLVPAPSPGTVHISFKSFGEWYDLRDNGSGGITAQVSGIGVGTIDYSTGSIVLTLSALPDVDSAIIWRWSKAITHYNRTDIVASTPSIFIQLPASSIDPTTLSITWGANSVGCDINGDLTGDATGTLDAHSGEVRMLPVALPPVGTSMAVGFFNNVWHDDQLALSVDGSGDYVFSIGETKANTVLLTWYVDAQEALDPFTASVVSLGTRVVQAVDDGAGNIITIGVGGGITIGTIDYATGNIIFDPSTNVFAPLMTRSYRTWSSAIAGVPQTSVYTMVNSSSQTIVAEPTVGGVNQGVRVRYATIGSTVSGSSTHIASEMVLPLTGDTGESVASESVRFDLVGDTYTIDGIGVVRSTDSATGANTPAGTINKTLGQLIITGWEEGAPEFDLKSVTTVVQLNGIAEVVLRVPNAPVRLNSFQLRATTVDGVDLTGDADANGDVLGTDIDATINYDTGVVKCRFGQLVVAAGNEGEDWYDAGEVDGNGDIFRPVFVDPSSIVYDAVSQTFIPLDASILGLNPVRLPEDGRVPVFNKGDVVVILNTQSVSDTYVSAATLDLGRTRIAKLTIVDVNGVSIAEAAYSADLDTGIITWGDLTGINQPLTVEHRIEDSRVLTDVQITGELGLSQPLSHDFPTVGTLVSSAVLHGDIFAHVNTPFDQQTWTGEWSDVLIGSGTLAEFNDALYPIVVDNASAVAERWLCQFVSATYVNVIGEHTGQILTNVPIANVIAPINPATGFPYFTIPTEAWGAGWSSGNALRFNTIAAHTPLWLIQSVGQGDPTNTDADALTFCIEFRGDRDAP